ncbi:MAG: response regulator [Thermoleophilia bacterium]
MLRLLLLEDEDLLRLTLATALPDESMEVVGAYGDAKSAIAAGTETAFDVLVTDLDLAQGQGPNGIVVANVLRRTKPEIGVVLLTSYADPRLVGTKLDQLPERTEYVRKHAIRDIDTLRAAIRRAALGANQPEALAIEANLTDTQVETMRLVAQGLSNAEIARQRVVTEGAVEVSLRRIARNLGYSNDSTRNIRALIVRAYFEMAGASGAQHRQPS